MNKESALKELKKLLSQYDLPYFHIVVRKDHELIFDYGFCKDNKENKNTVLPFYSMSKIITSTLLLQLVEEKKIKLSDLVSQYIPSFQNAYYFNEKKEKIFTNDITIEHLISMRAGMDYNLGQEEVMKLVKDNPNASTLDIVSTFPKYPLCFKPGTNYNYSLSVDVIAAIIEKIEGKPFSKVAEERIFQPLKMNHSTFKNCLDQVDHFLPEYIYQDGKIVSQPYWYNGFMFSKQYESGGAGLISNVYDYSLFLDALACKKSKDGVTLLNDKSYQDMTTCRTKDIKIGLMYSNCSTQYGYGLAVRVRKEKHPYFPLNEFGWDGACGCFALIDQTNHLSITIAMNLALWPNYIPNLHFDVSEILYKNL